MIENLRVGRAANFSRLQKSLSDAAVAALFRRVRAGTSKPSQNLFHHVREGAPGARWSAICFFHDRPPTFLRPPPSQSERLCGYLLIVEHRKHVAVFRSGLHLPSSFKAKYLERVSHERIEAATAKSDAVVEKVRLRNLSPSRLVMRAKTLEAADLSNAVGPAGTSRYAPQSAIRPGAPRNGSPPFRTPAGSHKELSSKVARKRPPGPAV